MTLYFFIVTVSSGLFIGNKAMKKMLDAQVQRYFTQSISSAQSLLDEKAHDVSFATDSIKIPERFLYSFSQENLVLELEKNLKDSLDFLLYVPYTKEQDIVSAGIFLYNLKPLEEKIVQKEIFLGAPQLIIAQDKDQVLVFILSSKKIIRKSDGKILGHLIGGCELGHDSSFLSSIKKLTKLEDVYLIANKIPLGKMHDEAEKTTLNINLFGQEQESVWGRKYFTFSNTPSNLELSMKLKTEELKDITQQLKDDTIKIFIIFLVLLIQVIFFVKSLFTDPLSNLKLYAKNLSQNIQNIQVPKFTIAEYADLARYLKTLFEELMQTRKKIDDNMRLIDKYVLTSATDINGNIIDVSSAFCKLSGYNKKELLGKNHRIMKSSQMENTIFEQMWKTISCGKIWEGEICNVTKSGKLYWTYNIISPVYENGQIVQYTALREDITHKKQLEDFAIKDPLTGLYNRRYIEETLINAQKIYNRHQEPFSLVLIDIDFFKNINDTYGHQIGDIVLKEFSRILLQNTRESDKVGRWGGEEFMIYMPKSTLEHAQNLAENIRKKIDEHKINEIKHLTASLGVAQYQKSLDITIKNADEALYRAKELGRNQVQIG